MQFVMTLAELHHSIFTLGHSKGSKAFPEIPQTYALYSCYAMRLRVSVVNKKFCNIMNCSHRGVDDSSSWKNNPNF